MNGKKFFTYISVAMLSITVGCATELDKQSEVKQTTQQSEQVETPEVDEQSKQEEYTQLEETSKQTESEEEKESNEETNTDSKQPQEQDVEPTLVKEVNGKKVIANPENQLVLVNKTNFLPSDYKPSQLVIPNVRFYFDEVIPKKHMQKEAAQALEELFATAEEKGLNLVAASGYRSYDRQEQIYQSQVKQVGEEKANQAVALPGQSEHQTGLAMDVTSPEMNFKLMQSFEDTKEGQWLKEHAHDYGFIIRYPKGKEETTGYQYEPWHLRYVGKEAAKMIFEQNITLEQYVNAVPVQQQEPSEDTEQ